jgi:hypothetical protein
VKDSNRHNLILPKRRPIARPSMGMKRLQCLLFACLLALISAPFSLAESPALDTDTLLKPLVDTSQPTTLQGNVAQKHMLPVNDTSPAPGKPLVLTGKVQTLQQAIESEKDTVDWYGWYLSARDYLSQTGGLRCALGTPIKFYKNGLIEALTFDPHCIASVSGRHFPLPANTQLDALILPVRPGQGPPASRQEIYSRVHALQAQ